MSLADPQVNLTTATNLFKIKYGKLSENVYNSANVLLARVKKEHNFVGKQMSIAVPTSFGGGVGSGILPTANAYNTADAQILAKKMYARAEIDREAIKAAATNEGSFVSQTKYTVQKAVESWMRNMSRTLFHNGSGSLGDGDGVTNVSGAGTTGSPYVVALNDLTFNEAHWENGDFVHYDAESGTGALLEVVDLDPDSSPKTVSLVGVSVGLAALTGAGPVPVATFFYMQNSANNDPLGLLGTVEATSGSVYGITVDRRWQGTVSNVAGAGLTTDRMNEVMLEVQRKSGKVPNLIVCSFLQYRKLLNILEDQKRYTLEPRMKDLKGKVSFSGVEFMSASGPVGVFPDRFCPAEKMYFLNDNFITIYHRPDFGWMDDDNTVFLRKADDDAYEARYGGYLQTYIPPSFHGVLDNLAT